MRGACRRRPSRYRFAEFTLSPARRSLRRAGREVPLIPRYLDLLILLVERRAVALPRREMLDRVWADVIVSDGALSQAVRTLRRTLGEDDHIRTVSRHGYQFVCPVLEEEDEDDHPPLPQSPRAEAAPGDQIADALARLLDGPSATRCVATPPRSCTRSARGRRCAGWRRHPPSPGASGRGRGPTCATAGGTWPARARCRSSRRRPDPRRGPRSSRCACDARCASPARGGPGPRPAVRSRVRSPGFSAGCHGRARRLGRALAARRSRSRRCGRRRGGRRRRRLRPRRGGGDRPLATRRRARRPRRARRGRRRVLSRHLALGLLDGLFGLDQPSIGGGLEGLRSAPRPASASASPPAGDGRRPPRRAAARASSPSPRPRSPARRSRPSCRRPAAGSARRASTPSSAASPPRASASTRSAAPSARTASAPAPGRPRLRRGAPLRRRPRRRPHPSPPPRARDD